MRKPPENSQNTINGEKVEYLGDRFRLRIVPSGQILGYCHERQEQNPYNTPQGEHYGTIEDATEDLSAAAYECEQIAQLLDIPDKQRLKGAKNATVSNYRQLIQLEHLRGLHSSHHAASQLDQPLNSALLLGDGKLTLGQLLGPSWRMPGMVEIFLSCCETNLGTPTLTDDILTLSTGFLCAGAQTVISTLWAVDSVATALLCLYYYQERQNRDNKGNRALSLQKAQQRLRNLKGSELKAEYMPKIEEQWELAEEKRCEAKEMQKTLTPDTPEYQYWQEQETRWNDIATACRHLEIYLIYYASQDHPFASPLYWSGFVCQGVA